MAVGVTVGPRVQDEEEEERNIQKFVTCDVCHELMLEPCTLNCGHTFCYTCLYEWFKKQDKWDPKTCPKCRTVVKAAPPISFAIRDIALVLNKNQPCIREALADIHKNNFGELFPGLFVLKPNPVYCDLDDGVRRCGNCHWEAEGSVCPHCGCRLVYRPPSEDDDDMEVFSDEETRSYGSSPRAIIRVDEDGVESIRFDYLGGYDDEEEDEEDEDEDEGSMVDFVEPDDHYDDADSSFHQDRFTGDDEDDNDETEQTFENEDDDEDVDELFEPSCPAPYRRVRTVPSVVVSDSEEDGVRGQQTEPIEIDDDDDDDDVLITSAEEPRTSVPDNEDDEDIVGTRRRRKLTQLADEDEDEDIQEEQVDDSIQAQDDELPIGIGSSGSRNLRRPKRRRSSTQQQRNKLVRQWQRLKRRRSRV